MGNGDGGGVGPYAPRPQGGVEITRTGVETEVKNPWAIFVGSCKADAAQVAAYTGMVYVFIFAICCLVVADHPPVFARLPGWLAWLPKRPVAFVRILVHSYSILWPWFATMSVAPLLLWLGRVARHAHLLVHYRWEVEQMDAFAHQPYGPRDPATRGSTWWDDRSRLGLNGPSEPAGRWQVSAVLDEGRTNVYLDFMVDDPTHWYRYCKAWQNGRKPNWSVRGFRGFGLAENYEDITAVFLSRGGLAIAKEYRDGRREYEPNARGRAFLRAFATTPPPQE